MTWHAFRVFEDCNAEFQGIKSWCQQSIWCCQYKNINKIFDDFNNSFDNVKKAFDEVYKTNDEFKVFYDVNDAFYDVMKAFDAVKKLLVIFKNIWWCDESINKQNFIYQSI